jgi:RNA 3'-terminal phosphate cyclase (ATP)
MTAQLPMMIEIDGSVGEGGGQVLRICLALSALTGESVGIKNIRINRATPGLRRQHVTAMYAAAEVASATVSGVTIGSSEITFSPGRRLGGMFHFDTRTAASTMLILQALLPVLAFADQHASVTLVGGTNNPMAPQVDYVINVLNPMLANMGFDYELRLVKRGFYPRGGGVIEVLTDPISAIRPLNVVKMGSILGINGVSHSRNLPAHVVERQARAATQSFLSAGYPNVAITLDADQKFESPSTGSGIVLWGKTSTGGILGGDALGARGKPAERVGTEAASKLLATLSAGAPLDAHLTDQLIIWLALANGCSKIKTSALTLHAVTAMTVTEALTGCKFKTRGEIGTPATIECQGNILR